MKEVLYIFFSLLTHASGFIRNSPDYRKEKKKKRAEFQKYIGEIKLQFSAWR
jgi:hypothetical protein